MVETGYMKLQVLMYHQHFLLQLYNVKYRFVGNKIKVISRIFPFKNMCFQEKRSIVRLKNYIENEELAFRMLFNDERFQS